MEGAFIGILAGILLLFGLYLYLIAPNLLRRKKGLKPPSPSYFAHRGLHDEETPENSLAAFRRAIDGGYGIELDVRISLDGEMMVFHDPNAKGLCGVDRLIQDMTLSELRALRLSGTGEGIPTLREALDLIDGKAPLIVEIKQDQPLGTALAGRVYDAMRAYKGTWWVESFDPRIVRWFRLHAPHVVRGQLAYDPAKLGMARPLLMVLGAHLMMNALSRPDFVAYGCKTRQNPSFRLMKRLFRSVLVAWTVESEEESQQLNGQFDAQIFEGFTPSALIKRS